MVGRFNEAHDSRYGHSNPGAPVELVAVRAAALGDLGHAEPEELAAGGGPPPAALPRRASSRAPSMRPRSSRARTLGTGARLEGPLVVEETTATTVVPPGCALTVDRYGSLIISIGREA